ncbi:MAG: alanine--tRNA ligase [Deltaproteobacteria bacterium]|nr:alanine--tRNA ligase [Deltaproteobacteria bacterium]
MSIRTAAEIREGFLRFFESKGHTRVSSSPLVPQNDPTLLFTNAGMNQFKDVFTGREKRDYSRAASSQKCVRAGGKHNDLDNVGHTARHHTFFEMLGNFSFGDYFKKDAVAYAWEFITSPQWLGLPVDKLAVTIFQGEGNIPADTEAEEFWKAQGVRPERIFRLGKKDNFWAMGDTGPCGPCSEIHIFRGTETDRAFIDAHAKKFFVDNAIADSDSWMELWNLVFMQFEVKEKDGPLLPLPKPSIDTGAGLERLSSVVQGVATNYDTDLLKAICSYAGELGGKKYGAGGPADIAMRVIADHSRAAAFLIADGVLPSNEGRGSTLRSIMRRAIRYGSQHLGLTDLFLFKTADKVIELMGAAYPELRDQRSLIVEACKNEETSFRKTLEKGLKMLHEEMAHLSKDARKTILGETVFYLYDTHGFPPDVTGQVARENGFEIDLDGFKAKQAEAKGTSEFKGQGEKISDVYFKVQQRVGDSAFKGYEGPSAKGKLIALIRGGSEVQAAKAGETVELVFDATPFYGESGGQVGDTGRVHGGDAEAIVEDAQKPVHGLVVHSAKIKSGNFEVGKSYELEVDDTRRTQIRANHSATHLLHRALKEILGEHVKQAGSVVAPDLLRFDFSHFAPVTPEELAKIERRVNRMIRENKDATTKELPIEEAKKTGAVSMFGEKYGARVRVVSVHPDSIEFCGGTHVHRSGDIGFFKITSEAGVAAGVRRIIALTGEAAVEYAEELEASVRAAAELLKGNPRELVQKVEATTKRMKELDKEIDGLNKKLAGAKSGDLMDKVREVKGVKILSTRIESGDAKVLRDLADKLRDKIQSGVVALGGEKEGKVLLLVAATPDLVKKGFHAGNLVKELAKDVGGSGGGKPDMAQAGGTDPSKLEAALNRVYDLVTV